MKMAVRAMLVALATLALASPSFAATVAPTSYPSKIITSGLDFKLYHISFLNLSSIALLNFGNFKKDID